MKKPYEPETIKELEIPTPMSYQEINDAPRSIAELNPQEGINIQELINEFNDLGDLAFLDLVNELQIADAAITNAKIAVDAIQGDIIAAGAITETKISDNAITTPKIQAGSITGAKIQAGTITANEIQAGTITANKMNVSQLSAISANLGTINAGSINGVTITGGTVRTSSGNTRVELSGGNNDVRIFNAGVLRARGFDQGWSFFNASGGSVGSIYGDGTSMLLQATSNVFLSAGASGVASLAVNGNNYISAIGGSNQIVSFSRDLVPIGSLAIGAPSSRWVRGYIDRVDVKTAGRVFINGGMIGGGSGWSATNTGTGTYQVNHNMNTTSYSVVVTPVASTTREVSIMDVNSNSFTVRIYNNATGSLFNTPFNFLVFGW